MIDAGSRWWTVLACLSAVFSSSCSSSTEEPLEEEPYPVVAGSASSRSADEPEQRGARRKQSDQFSNILLYTQHGEPVRFYDDLIKDKAVMINLMYTTCPDICPANTVQLVVVHELLEEWMGRDITMLSLSIDPVVDTPEQLKRYWEVFGSKPGWLFLTGDYDEIDRLRHELGVYDLDPVIDADKTQHAGIITIGNDRTNRWTALPIMMHVRQLAGTILRTTWDEQWRGLVRTLRQTTAEPEAYRGRGILRSVAAEKGEVVIDHEDIPGMMMGMTMSFEVADRAMLEGLSPNQLVDFRVKRAEDRYQILTIEASSPAPPLLHEDAPGAAGSTVAVRGEGNYATYCTACHGPRGDGDGPMAALLDPKPTQHSDAALMSAFSDEQLFKVIKDGGPAVGKSPQMAAWGELLSDQNIRDLVDYVRSLAL